MFKTIILKELLEHLKGYKFVIVFASCFILLGFNNAVMYQDYKSRLSDNSLKFSLKTPINKKAEPLSIYVTGTNELINRSFMYVPEVSALIDSGVVNFRFFSQYFPLIDFNYLVRVILSFLAMVVGFDAVCGEKQNGTLKLMLSNAVPRPLVVWGKITGSFLTLILPFVFTSLFFYVILAFQSDIHFNISDNIRLMLMMFVSIIYLSIFLIISIAVSASSATIKESIIKNFIIWATIIFIIPNFSTLLAKNKGQLPDGRKIQETYLLNAFETMEKTKLKPDSKTIEKELFNYSSDVLDFRNKLKRQIEVIEFSALIIPSNAFNLCITSLANSGLEDEDHFRRAVLNYYQELAGKKTNSDFTYSNLGLNSSIMSCLKYIISLFFFALAMLVIMVNRFNHYDIR